MKSILIVLFVFVALNMKGQQPAQPVFNGFFVGGMAYTSIYPAPAPVLQFSAGASFRAKRLLFDIVPVQISHFNGRFEYGASFMFRQYLFKK